MIKATVTRKDATDQVLKDLQDKALAFVAAGGEEIRSNAIDKLTANGNIVSGNLKNSIITESFVENGVPTSETGVSSEAPYGKYIEYGTGIYAVGGNGRKTPWWYETPEGQWIFTRGGRAYPFMEPGYQNSLQTINRLKEVMLKL